ncbi:UDP-N-acetylmuramate--L-alanine ligase [Candidatus Mycalebacterium sp.]
MNGKFRKIHMVGIAGSGMRGLAEVFISMGYEVSGSDTGPASGLVALENAGAKVMGEHAPENVKGSDVVVVSSAIGSSNPELTAAKRLGIPVAQRAEMLAELMRMKLGISVMGSHGKTTTTSMIASVLTTGGLDPTVIVGGKVAALGKSGRVGGGDIMVAEADESDGSFSRLSPAISVLTNVDREHLDYHGTVEVLRGRFLEFLEKAPFYGLATLCVDCAHVREISKQLSKRFITYGENPDADFRMEGFSARGFEAEFDVFFKREKLGRAALPVPGRHNAVNSLAAVAVGMEMGLSFDDIKRGLKEFSGIERRMQLRDEVRGIKFIDDYGHHPEEIRVTFNSVSEAFALQPVVVFQPHRFTRTHLLFDGFVEVLSKISKLYVLDVFPAGEEPIKGATSEDVVKKVKSAGGLGAVYAPCEKDLVNKLKEDLSEGDIVLTLGAGNVWRCAEALADELR